MEPIAAGFDWHCMSMDKGIRAISPFPKTGARPDKRAGWGFEQNESGQSPFASRMRALTKDQDNKDQPTARFNSFENPAFNIISASNNYFLKTLASDIDSPQMELFAHEKRQIRR